MPPKKTAIKKPAVKKVPVKKSAVKKPAVKKVPVKKSAVKKPAVKKVPVKKSAVKKPAVKAKAPKQPKKTADGTKFSVPPRVLLEEKAHEKGESVEGLVTEREIQLKSVQEYLGLQQKQDFHSKPIIPDVYDLLIPPGTPRKLILQLAKEYPVQIVRRDDIYVPVGVSDVERDLLAIRGDKKTIKKMEKILLGAIDSFINGNDARLHDYSKPVKLEGISNTKAASKSPSKVKKAKA